MARTCQKTSELEMAAESNLNVVGTSRLYGSLYNRSLDTDYRDPQIRIDFYDQAGTPISSEVLIVDKRIEAGEAEKFALDFTAPVGTESAEWDIVCAVAR